MLTPAAAQFSPEALQTVIGIVAVEEAVEKAVSSASDPPLRNRNGFTQDPIRTRTR